MAEHGGAGVDQVGPGEARPAHAARLTPTAVDHQLELEVAGFAGAGAVIAERRPLRIDGGLQDPPDLAVQAMVLGGLDPVRRT